MRFAGRSIRCERFHDGINESAAQIVITNSAECVDIPHGQAVDGTPQSLFNCHGSPSRQWSIQ